MRTHLLPFSTVLFRGLVGNRIGATVFHHFHLPRLCTVPCPFLVSFALPFLALAECTAPLLNALPSLHALLMPFLCKPTRSAYLPACLLALTLRERDNVLVLEVPGAAWLGSR